MRQSMRKDASLNNILRFVLTQYFLSAKGPRDPAGRDVRHHEEVLQDPKNCSRFERPRQALFIA